MSMRAYLKAMYKYYRPIFGKAAITLGLAHVLVGIILCYSLFVYMCFCCVIFGFFSIMRRDWLGRTSPK